MQNTEGRPLKIHNPARLARFAAALLATVLPLWCHAAPSCVIASPSFYGDSYLLRDLTVSNTGAQPLSGWHVEIEFDQPAAGTKVWGAAQDFRAQDSRTVSITPTADPLAPGASTRFSLKGEHGGALRSATCRVVSSGGGGGGGGDPPPPPPDPVKCGTPRPGIVLSQGFDSFTPGTPLLSAEHSFKNEFCTPLRYTTGFGNDAEPPISTLSGKALSDRLGREAMGQYNGASSTVRVSIDTTQARRGQSMKVLYPRGTNTSSHSGMQFDMPIVGAPTYDRNTRRIVGSRSFDELHISYWVKFENNFDWAFGGKLPGLYALEAFDAPSRNNEIKSRLMWREGGKLEFYLHSPHEPRERLLWNNVAGLGHATLSKGVWHNLEFRMKLNTVGANGTVVADGVLQGWLDGRLFGDYRDLRFRNSAAVNLNAVFFSTFFGGSSGSGGPGEIWWPSRDVHAWFDEILVSPNPIRQQP
jgi:Cellulose binding domain